MVVLAWVMRSIQPEETTASRGAAETLIIARKKILAAYGGTFFDGVAAIVPRKINGKKPRAANRRFGRGDRIARKNDNRAPPGFSED